MPLPITIIPVKLPSFCAALVIADDRDLRNLIVQNLKLQNWIVHKIRSAEHALPILAYIPYGLIIIAVNCPA
jgi:DNA-binding response OmpR family regulator